ncbi:mediator of RNA polymerase II transcription subunit 7 isoform 2 [Planoprotostelium fungivorum]|uniref:Mediator of RNA polymerase II transcription subunit 7 n=1 Tax=Planoprotostelium fungivorum TaxID=1890364 RepID=A0A2P6NC48_9EUKA|nr:mediator of RNA polymerase II transcription subunit 7 isoform 2 [Planoprotostelium fungivorum]
MDEGQTRLVSSLPPPPGFYKLYTDVNLGKVPPQEGERVEPPPSAPPPPEDTYSMFGRLYTTRDENVPLEPSTQLYSLTDTNHVQELNKLNKSLAMKYIELITYLIHEPEQYEQKIGDLHTILLNMHHLINSYRPHQARQTLISLMEQQRDNRRDQIKSTDTANEEVIKLLKECRQQLRDDEMDAMSE